MNSKIKAKAKELGFCCPWKFMVQLKRQSSLRIAKTFKVTQRTARNWKRRMKQGELKCEAAGTKLCQRYQPGAFIELVPVRLDVGDRTYGKLKDPEQS